MGDDHRGRGRLEPQFSLPKNRSTGNLASTVERVEEPSGRNRYRMSLDATAAASVAADLESITR